MTTEHVTRQNILDYVEGLGREMAAMAAPNYWAHEDNHRAAPYAKKRDWCRWAYTAIRNGENAGDILTELKARLVSGGEVNSVCRLLEAIDGKYATTGEQLVRGTHGFWVTYGGDFYGVERGDHLNSARVERRANRNLPADRRVVEGAEIIAAMVPNPCTRNPGPTRAA